MDEQQTQQQQTNEAPLGQFSNDAPAPAATTTATQTSEGGWSWGGFILGPLFAIATKRYSYLLLLLIPGLGGLIMMILLGLNGRNIAMQSPTFSNNDEVRGFMKGVDHAGFISFILGVAVFAAWILFVVVILGTVLNSF